MSAIIRIHGILQVYDITCTQQGIGPEHALTLVTLSF